MALGVIGNLDSQVGIPVASHFVGVHTVGEVDRGGDIDIVEGVEGGRDGHTVTHTVAPVLDEAFLEKFVLLGSKRILELSVVG